MPLNNPEVKAAWVTKLRSGEIKQATGALERPDGSMCCLGVLMTVQGNKPHEFYNVEPCNDPRCDDPLSVDFVPTSFRNGLTIEEMHDLSNRNDGNPDSEIAGEIKGQSFAEIADHIEANL